jgi:hypothetical protein
LAGNKAVSVRKSVSYGWLGRQDSNLGMAESKSTNFPFAIKAHSEKSAKFASFQINSLALGSE